MGKLPPQIEEYFAKLTPAKRAGLAQMRALIHAAAPDAEDLMSYGVPAIKYQGQLLVLYAAFKAHYGLYPYEPEIITALAKELEAYDTAKGTVRFPLDAPLPEALIGKIVRAKMAMIAAGGNR